MAQPSDLSQPILAVDHLKVVYQQVIHAVHDVSFAVPQSGFTVLLGANGAGKSTTLKAISRLLGAARGEVTHGDIHYQGHSILTHEPHTLVRAGLAQVLEGRRCFAHLTVEENLLSGTLGGRLTRVEIRRLLDETYARFPRLEVKRTQYAGLTSGGEQQMLAIARALLTQPRLLLLDEPSMGLAPQIVEEVFALLHTLHQEEGLSLLIAEQNAHAVLPYARDAVVLNNGTSIWHGAAADLIDTDVLSDSYLGVQEALPEAV